MRICDCDRRRVGHDKRFSLRAGIAQRGRDGRVEILDRQHGSPCRQRAERKRNRQARNPVDGREVSFLAFAVNHDGTQDRKRDAGRAYRLLGGKFGPSIRIVRCRKIILGEVVIRIGAGLGGDRGNENQMLCRAARYCPRQRRCRTMIHAIIKIVAGVFVGNACEIERRRRTGRAGLASRTAARDPKVKRRSRPDCRRRLPLSMPRPRCIPARQDTEPDGRPTNPSAPVTSTLVFLLSRPCRSDPALDCAPAPSQAGTGREFIGPGAPFRR